MVLKLYGNIHSTCTARVRTVLEELSIPYELVELDFGKPGALKTPEVLAVQPFGQIPYIDDDGFKLCESRVEYTPGHACPRGITYQGHACPGVYSSSRAIARYLAYKYGGVGELIPDVSNLQKLALCE